MSGATKAAVALVLILLLGASLLLSRKTPEPKGTITIGAPLLLSGDFVSYGERAKRSIDLAVEDFKTKHPGLEVNVIYEDTHADVKQAVSAYRKLIDVDNVDMIVGPMLQTEMAALVPLISQDGVPVVSISPVPEQDRGKYTNPLVLWPDPSREAAQMAQYVWNQGVRSVAVIGTVDAWENEVSDAFATTFKSLGGAVTDQETTLPDTKDDKTPVTKLLRSKPEAIFFGTYYKFFDFVKNARQLGFTGKMYSIEIDSYMAEQTKGYSDGVRFISPNFYTPAYVAEFQKAYGEVPTIPGGQAYDATTIALTLYTASGNDRSKMLAAMKDLRSFDGVSGKITWDENRRAIFSLNIFEIQNGEINKIN